jgi:hypothetical protein
MLAAALVFENRVFQKPRSGNARKPSCPPTYIATKKWAKKSLSSPEKTPSNRKNMLSKNWRKRSIFWSTEKPKTLFADAKNLRPIVKTCSRKLA